MERKNNQYLLRLNQQPIVTVPEKLNLVKVKKKTGNKHFYELNAFNIHN